MLDPVGMLVLGAVADAFINQLVTLATNKVREILRKDPAKVAFKQALAAAIQRYAKSKQMGTYLVSPLLEQKSFLTLPAVIEELTHLMRFDRELDAKLIGQKWEEAFDNPPAWCDFTSEAHDFLTLLAAELRNTDVFRPVFEAQSLAAIVSNTTTSAQSLLHIETQLAQLQTLLHTQFAELTRTFLGAPSSNIRDNIHDFTAFINERTRSFVGRQFVIDAFTRFTEHYPSGYFFLRGDPGAGKSALAAHLVQMHGYIHHFNIRSEGINTTEIFLKNICAQLIARYKLDYPYLPPETVQDAGILKQLLEKVSTQLQEHEKAVIIVDALDEVRPTDVTSDANTLYLPANLPPKIYFFVTMRRVELSMRIECDFQPFDIVHDSADNLADTREYLALAVGRPGIQTYITAQGIDSELFIEHLVEKSEGNFMYLRYVLPEIERGEYNDLDLKALPKGLQDYYEKHWQRMRDKDREHWFQYELPVIATLTAVYKPVSIEFIARRTGVSIARISAILSEWEQFLHSETVPEGDVLQERYWVYHMSFHDFLAQKKEVEGGRSILQEAHSNIARSLLRKGSKDGKLSRNTE